MKKNLSILLLTMGSGGAERVVSNILPILQKRYHVTLVLFYDVFHFDIPENIDVEVIIKKKNLSILDKITVFFTVLKRYNKILNEKEIDISLSLLTRPNLVNAFCNAKNVRRVISERCYPSIAYRSNYLRYLLYKVLLPIGYNKVDHLYSNSHFINEDLHSNFGLKIPSSVIYNPVRLEDKKVYSRTEELSLITVGSMTPIKNQELILRSIIDLEGVSLSMVGDGPLRGELESIVETESIIEKVKFIGKVKDVPAILTTKDLFILSSNSEGFPNALLEAMACGLAVISTNCLSGPLELLNNGEKVEIATGSFYKAKYGLLINVDDKEGMRNAINYFRINKAELIAFGSIAHDRAKDFSIPTITDQLVKILEGE